MLTLCQADSDPGARPFTGGCHFLHLGGEESGETAVQPGAGPVLQCHQDKGPVYGSLHDRPGDQTTFAYLVADADQGQDCGTKAAFDKGQHGGQDVDLQHNIERRVMFMRNGFNAVPKPVFRVRQDQRLPQRITRMDRGTVACIPDIRRLNQEKPFNDNRL